MPLSDPLLKRCALPLKCHTVAHKQEQLQHIGEKHSVLGAPGSAGD